MCKTLQHNKILMISISMLLCFGLLFGLSSVAVEPVQAIAGVDDIVLYVLASVCLSLAIGISCDPIDFGDTFKDLYYSLSDTAKQQLEIATFQFNLGASYVFEYSPEVYGQLTTEIIDYFNSNSVSNVDGIIVPNSDSGKIGFTSDTSFSCYYPYDVGSCSYKFPSSTLIRYSNYDIPSAYPSFISMAGKNLHSGYDLCNDDGFGYVRFDYPTQPLAGKTFYSKTVNSFIGKIETNTTPYYSLFSPGFYGASSSSYPFQGSEYQVFYDSLGNFYGLSNINGSYRLYDLSNSSHYYNDLSFPSLTSFTSWFYHSCGFVVPYNSDVDAYSVPTALDPAFTYDADVTSSAQTANLNTAEVNGSMPIVIAGNDADAQVLLDNPSVVTDISEASTLLPLVTDYESHVTFGFNSIIDWLSNFWDNLVGLFVPPPDFWGDGIFAPLFTALENKFTFLAGLQNWMDYFANVGGEGISFTVFLDFLLGFYRYLKIPITSDVEQAFTLVVDLAFYEPYRLNIRALLSVVIAVLSTLKCLRLLTHALNLPIVNENVSQSVGVSK